MKRFHIQCDMPHPEDAEVRLTFSFDAPYVSVKEAREGLELQARIKWRRRRNG